MEAAAFAFRRGRLERLGFHRPIILDRRQPEQGIPRVIVVVACLPGARFSVLDLNAGQRFLKAVHSRVGDASSGQVQFVETVQRFEVD